MGISSDYDPVETQEWIDSLRAVVHHAGPERGAYLLTRLREEARRAGAMPKQAGSLRQHRGSRYRVNPGPKACRLGP